MDKRSPYCSRGPTVRDHAHEQAREAPLSIAWLAANLPRITSTFHRTKVRDRIFGLKSHASKLEDGLATTLKRRYPFAISFAHK